MKMQLTHSVLFRLIIYNVKNLWKTLVFLGSRPKLLDEHQLSPLYSIVNSLPPAYGRLQLEVTE
mgnify:CR=1 FL=1